MRRILRYAPRPAVASAVALSVVAAVCAQSLPFLQRRAIDLILVPALSGARSDLEREATVKRLVELMAAFLACATAAFFANYGFSYLARRVGQRVLDDLRKDACAKLLRLPISYFDRNAAGHVVSRVMGDVEAIGRFVGFGLVEIAQSSVVFAAVLAFMFAMDWRLAFIGCTAVPILSVVISCLKGRQRNAHRALRAATGALTAAFAENVAGMSTVQIFNREPKNRLKFDHLNREVLDTSLEAQRWFTLLGSSLGFIGGAAMAALIWVGGLRVLAGAATVGTLFAFTQYLRTFFLPLADLSTVSETLQAAIASAERVFAVLDAPEAVGDAPDAVAVRQFRGEVELRGVWFSYAPPNAEPKPDEWVLRGIDLHVLPGEAVALVGATGAGKSTFMSLLARLYDVQKGAVLIDGVDVRHYAQRELRRHVGVVLQDPFLFAGTIEANLTLRDDTPTERAIEACKAVGIHEFIQSLPHGYQTEVGERGAKLSTGQKQLLAFARALALDPDIIVVLDEATANVDSESESTVTAALKRVMRGRTSIVIAHRLSTIRDCDRIVVLRQGSITEQGTHQALLARGGYYATLVSLGDRDAA